MRLFNSLKVTLLIVALMMVMILLPGQTALAQGDVQHTTSEVWWFDPFPVHGDPVEGGNATLMTDETGAVITVQTDGLTPNDAVTIWWVIFNNPEACAGYPDEACTLDDLQGNTEAVGGEVGYATGHVIGESGTGIFGAYLPVGEVPHPWFGNEFTNPMGAEIHLVIHTHGQVIPLLKDEMVSTFRAGCEDDEAITPEHPAHGDGTPGPNTCQDLQFVIFQQQ